MSGEAVTMKIVKSWLDPIPNAYQLGIREPNIPGLTLTSVCHPVMPEFLIPTLTGRISYRANQLSQVRTFLKDIDDWGTNSTSRWIGVCRL